VSRATVEELLEAARYAPTGHNARDLECVAVCSEGRRLELRNAIVGFYRRIFRIAGHPLGRALLTAFLGPARVGELRDARPGVTRAEERLAQGGDPLFHQAPAILLFQAPPTETAETDCAVAAAQVTLLAPSLGLGTCYIGYASAALRRSRRMAARFGVPRHRRVYTVLTLGYPSCTYRRWVPRPPIRARFL
jgi:nitroreductase